MTTRKLRIAGLVTLIVLLLYGLLVRELQLPPYGFIRAAYNHFFPPEEYIETPQEYLETDVDDLISIRQQQDVPRLRKVLIDLLFGEPGLPSSFPSEVHINIVDYRFADLPSLNRMDELVIKMDFGLESHVYHFIPKTPNNKVVLYHQGHDGDFYLGKEQIGRFLDNGYSVVALDMPLVGRNNQPTVKIPRLGYLAMTSHDQMKFLAPEHGHPVKYFLEPVVIVLNYLEHDFEYSSVSMVGISGGGWTTTLAAAIDTRIYMSFPVAGSYPIFLRSNSPRDWGDYEQTVPELYATVTYLELYILGANGPNRKQLQVINQYDACCFAGVKSGTYKDVVKERVFELGPGEFDLFMDSTHNSHIVSEAAMNRILDELGNNDE